MSRNRKLPYSRMFYVPEQHLMESIESGVLTEKYVSDMSGDVYFESLQTMEDRVYRVFVNAKLPGSKESTDNSIYGVADDIGSLALYVDRHLGYKGYVVHEYDVPEQILRLKSEYCELFAASVRVYVIQKVLELLSGDGDIWFDAGRQSWTVRQSNIDEYKRRYGRARADKRRLKVDLRTYHGRNRAQSTRRGVPEGTSIGYCA